MAKMISFIISHFAISIFVYTVYCSDMEVIFVEEVINLLPSTSMDKEKRQTSRRKDKPSESSRKKKELSKSSIKGKTSNYKTYKQKEKNADICKIQKMWDDLDDEIFLSRDLALH